MTGWLGIVCLFCLFVGINPENPHFASRSGLEVNPLGVYPLGPRSSSCGPTKKYTTAQNHSTYNLWLTLYKLMGWLASLDLRKPFSHLPRGFFFIYCMVYFIY